MKLLYLTVPSFFDLEISLIRELSRQCDVHVILTISPQTLRSSAFCIDSIDNRCSLINASDYPGMEKYSNLIDLKKWIIANNPDNSIRSCRVLASLIKKHIVSEGYEMIHSTPLCKTTFFLLPFIYRFQNTLYTVHDPLPHQAYTRLREFLVRDLPYRCYKNVLLLSSSYDKDFQRKYSGKYTRLFHSSLSVYDYLSSIPIGMNDYGKYILFFGRIDHYKGVDLLLKAFLETEAYRKGYKLVVAGKSAPDIGEISVDNPQIVVINRYINNDLLATLVYHSQFVVLPYTSATQSGCLFSAYAFCKPVLATMVGELQNRVINNETGLLISPNKIEELIKGIDRMVNSDLCYMSERIRALYSGSGELGWKAISEGLVSIYYSIISAND